MNKKKLFLIDAYALIFRGYYALMKNPRINSKGMNTSAILGFVNTIVDVIRKESPDFIAVAFDKGGSQSRTALFEDYKANRLETPEDIRIAVPYIYKILSAMNIAVVEKPGYEADDIIGTLAKQAEKEGLTVYMMTPDKDYAQLVSDNIFMYRPARMGNGVEIWGIDEVKRKFGVNSPDQVVDFLGMMGDASDNIPGLPGVGEKTAMKFISEYGSMENLLSNADKISGKLGERIRENKHLGEISKKLARIMLDVPVSFSQQEFKVSSPDMVQLKQLFDELEFRQLWQNTLKLYSSEGKVNSSEEEKTVVSVQTSLFDADLPEALSNITNTPHLYQLVDTDYARKLLLSALTSQKAVCFDTETTGVDSMQAQLVGIAFSWQKSKGYYVPFPADRALATAILEEFRPFFENERIVKIAQNVKYDLKILRQYDIDLKGNLFDTMIAHYLLQPDMRHSMDLLSKSYLKYEPISIETLIGKKGKNQLSMADIEIEKVKEYAVEDADVTYQLSSVFNKGLKENNLQKLYLEIEAPLIKVLADMEIAGVRLDVDFLKQLSADLERDAQQIEEVIFAQAGERFNLASPKQLGDILFEKLKISSKPKKTKTGQYATSEAILSTLSQKHNIVRDILEWRQVQKLKSTYADALPNEVDVHTGRIHTTYMQTIAATGRLSSVNPNLQNIPIRSQRGQQIRKAFIARDENYLIMSADYSQIELRIIAALSKEPTMIKAFQNNEDIHTLTASRVFGVARDAVTREQRSYAKTINFGIIYGVSAFGLSNQTELSRTESKELIDAYYQTYPVLKSYISEQIERVRSCGYAETICGRRRYLPDIHSGNQVVRSAAERNAVNAPIQGSAADIIKIAMIKVHQQLKNRQLKSQLLMQIHDELIIEVYKPEEDLVKQIVRYEMETAYQLEVPLVVDIGVGTNWFEAH